MVTVRDGNRIAWTIALTAPVLLVGVVPATMSIRQRPAAVELGAGPSAVVHSEAEAPDDDPAGNAAPVPSTTASPAQPSATSSELLPNTAEEDKDPSLGPIYSIEEFSVGYESVTELTQGVDQVIVGIVINVGPGSSNAWNIYEAITVKVDTALSGVGAPPEIQFEDIAREATTNRPVIALNQLDYAPGDRVLLFLNKDSSSGHDSEVAGEPPAYLFPNRQALYLLEDAATDGEALINPDTAIADTDRTDPLIEQVEALPLAQLLQEIRAATADQPE